MNSKPLISVVIIFLNAEKFIKEAIESVFTQTYDNWELLLVDDGSTDKSTQVAKSYANQHRGKVHYLEHDGHINRGMSASRNLGIRKSKGTYIAFLDADDVWFPNKLEEQLKILLSYPEVSLKEQVYVSGQCWARYRIHPDQFTVKAVKAGEYDSVRFYYLKWLKDYLYKQNFKNPEI